MKKKLSVLILFLAIIIGIFLGIVSRSKKVDPISAVPSQVQPTVTVSPSPAIGLPVHLTIPSLNISANIESVGMDGQGRMDVPQNTVDVAWYNLGFRPGQKGSAVIDGHYDTQTGAPAVFYYISSLSPGNTMQVTDDAGTKYTFTVVQNTNYPYNNLPMQQIFASTDKARLNLITCSGVWDHAQHNYSTRDVVYAELTSKSSGG